MLKEKEYYKELSILELEKIEKSASYKWQVFFYRLKKQFIIGKLKEKIDFVRYLFNTVCRKHFFFCKSRYYFDPIIQIRVEADRHRMYRYARPAKDSVFIFVSPPAYSTGGGQRGAQLARNFAHEGKQVYYYYAAAFHAVPIETELKLNYQHQAIFDVSVDEVLKVVGEESVFIFEAPVQEFLPYLQIACKRKIPTIYEHIDNWETALGNSFYQDSVQQKFLDLADVITVTSYNLTGLLAKKTQKKIYYSPNAVDDMIFDGNREYEHPDDLINGSRGGKTIIYFGTLWAEWIDWSLIMETAERCKDSSFNMIGERRVDKEKEIMDKCKNIYFLGEKKQQDLPAYLKYSDIAIIPFRKCKIGMYVSPIKIFEYLAMGITVLTTSLPDISNYPNTISCDTSEEWEGVIRKGELAQTQTDCGTFIAVNCWRARCMQLLKLAEERGKA